MLFEFYVFDFLVLCGYVVCAGRQRCIFTMSVSCSCTQYFATALLRAKSCYFDAVKIILVRRALRVY